ncbi:MAG: rod shape-determining protein MreC [Candidatus Pacebacteria bacterium]|nr:rod shape-determining protein MreC [Candidatus Paceibacterota bacterium]
MTYNPTKKRLLALFILLIVFSVLALFSSQVKSFFYNKSLNLQMMLWHSGQAQKIDEEVKKLTEENQNLLSRLADLEEARKENEFLRRALDLGLEKEFDMILAQATAKNVFTLKGITFEDSILINKGKNDGIRKDFPVILADKILVGKVAEVYDSFSRVVLISNKDSMIDIEVQDTGLFALAKGEGNLKISLDLFPKDQELNDGALAYTSALGGIYPSGLVLGQVRNIKKIDNEAFIKADIEPAFILAQLDRVFVIKTAEIVND